jgi:glutaryl-CoA dehydrogenase
MSAITAVKPSALKRLPPPNSDFYRGDFERGWTRETVSWARELLGGNGILVDYNVARFLADAEAFYSDEGTNQMQNLIVGKEITGFSAYV